MLVSTSCRLQPADAPFPCMRALLPSPFPFLLIPESVRYDYSQHLWKVRSASWSISSNSKWCKELKKKWNCHSSRMGTKARVCEVNNGTLWIHSCWQFFWKKLLLGDIKELEYSMTTKAGAPIPTNLDQNFWSRSQWLLASNCQFQFCKCNLKE